MADTPIKGSWSAVNTVPYASAAVWGTGVNPIHAMYGEGPALRTTGRNDDRPETHAPHGAPVDRIATLEPWGYTPEDQSATPYLRDDLPAWDETTPEFRDETDHHPAYDAPGSVKTLFRSMFMGPRKANYKSPDGQPNETVTEGWRNKAKGSPANAVPSDPEQYEMQTSMVQRYRTRGNEHAVARSTDDPRATIDSRVAGQKLKVYSEGERHYDMFPYQQDSIPRAFWYRKAGTGAQGDMLPNEMYVSEPIQRTPPPDPSLGVTETDTSFDYGYTAEDSFYA